MPPRWKSDQVWTATHSPGRAFFSWRRNSGNASTMPQKLALPVRGLSTGTEDLTCLSRFSDSVLISCGLSVTILGPSFDWRQYALGHPEHPVDIAMDLLWLAVVPDCASFCP